MDIELELPMSLLLSMIMVMINQKNHLGNLFQDLLGMGKEIV